MHLPNKTSPAAFSHTREKPVFPTTFKESRGLACHCSADCAKLCFPHLTTWQLCPALHPGWTHKKKHLLPPNPNHSRSWWRSDFVWRFEGLVHHSLADPRLQSLSVILPNAPSQQGLCTGNVLMSSCPKPGWWLFSLAGWVPASETG